MAHEQQTKQNSKKLIEYIKANPNQNTKSVKMGLGWSENKTFRYLKMNKDKLENGWRAK